MNKLKGPEPTPSSFDAYDIVVEISYLIPEWLIFQLVGTCMGDQLYWLGFGRVNRVRISVKVIVFTMVPTDY